MNRFYRYMFVCILSLLPVAGMSRDLTVAHAYPKSNGFVRIVTEMTPKHGIKYRTDTQTWFQDNRKFRVVSCSTLQHSKAPRMLMYQVLNGKIEYTALVYPDKHGEVRWSTVPSSWLPVDPFGHPDCTIRQASLVGYETVHGLRTEHWRGLGTSKIKAAKDVWISTDPRYPLLMRARSASKRVTYQFDVTELKLVRRVPECMFTPQISPKSDWLTMVTLPYRSPLSNLIWHAFTLMAYAGVAYAIAYKVSTKRRWGRAGIGILSLMILMPLLRWFPDESAYLGSSSSIPMFLAQALLSGLLIMLLLWKLPPLSGVAFLNGTTRLSLLFVPAALLIGTSNQFTWWSQFTSVIGLKHWSLSLLPIPLLSTLLCAAPSAAVEEIVFRGYLLQALLERTGSARLAIVIQAVVFGLYHIPNRLGRMAFGGHMAVDVVVLMAYGLMFGMLRLRYHNLGLPWLVHAAVNVGIIYTGYAGLAGAMNAMGKM